MPGADTFIKTPHWLLARTDISPRAKAVFQVVCDRMGADGAAFPSHRRIAKDAGFRNKDVASVSRAVKQLENVGLLKVERGDSNPGGKPNRYRLGENVERSADGTLLQRNVPPPQRSASGNETFRQRKRNVPPAEQNQTKLTRPINQTKGARGKFARPEEKQSHNLVRKAIRETFGKRAVNKATRQNLDEWTNGFLGLGATPDEIRAARAVYAGLHPDQTFGPAAVIEHWSEVYAVICRADRTAENSAASAERAATEKKTTADKAASDKAIVRAMPRAKLEAVVKRISASIGKFMADPPALKEIADDELWVRCILEEARK